MLKTEIASLGYEYLSDANGMSWIIVDDHGTSLHMYCQLPIFFFAAIPRID